MSSVFGIHIKVIGDAVVTFFSDYIVGFPVYGFAYNPQPVDIDKAIDNGNVVMTNVLENGKRAHNILIIGYTPNGEYIYIDPRDDQNFYKCSKDTLKEIFKTKYIFELSLSKKE